MLGEDQIPDEVLENMLSPQQVYIFLTVEDPDQWPQEMKPFREWVEQIG